MRKGGRSTAMAAAMLALAACSAGRADDWPQWRGPKLNGSTDEGGLPERFSGTENVAWRAPMPGGAGATPIIVGERIFISSTVRGGQRLVGMCLSSRDGKLLWSKRLGTAGRVPRADLASQSPVADGKRVVFTFGSGEIASLDLQGNVLWKRDLTREYGCLAIMFGWSSSPLLYDGRLYVLVMRREKPYPYNLGAKLPREGDLDSFLLCIDPATGKNLWRHVRQTDAVDESREAYVTPMPCELAGRKEIVVHGGTYVTGHDAATGRELWRWAYKAKVRPTQQRVIAGAVIGEGFIFAPQARNDTGVIALKPPLTGLVPHKDLAWRFDGPTPDATTPLIYRGRLYVLAGDRKVITCLDPATGKVVWQHKLPAAGPYRASPTGADGRIFCLSEGGDVIVLAAGEEFRELLRFSLAAAPCRGSIAVAGRSLYLRTPDELLCIRKPPVRP